MAEQDPEYIQDVCKSAEMDRQTLGDLVCEEGVTEFAALRVTESSPAALSVTISSGGAFIDNDQDTADGEGGTYHVYNAGDVVLNISANNSGSTRTDSVWARVCDSQYAAVTSDFDLVVVEGNTVAPADGCTYYKLATVTVPDAAVAINGNPDDFGASDGQITDDRSRLEMCGVDAPIAIEYLRGNGSSSGAIGTTATAVNGCGFTVPAQPYERRVILRGQFMCTATSVTNFFTLTLRKGGAVFGDQSQAREGAAHRSISIEQDDVLAAGVSAFYQLFLQSDAGTTTPAFTGDGRNFSYLTAEVHPT